MTSLVHRSWPCSFFTVASVHQRQVLPKLHRLAVCCFKALTCPSPLQPVHQAKPCLPPWSHDSMSCLICNELLLIITYGLITCVSLYATLLVHLMLSLNYQNQTSTFQPPHVHFPLHSCMNLFLLGKTQKQCTIKIVGSTLNLECLIFVDKIWISGCLVFEDGGCRHT